MGSVVAELYLFETELAEFSIVSHAVASYCKVSYLLGKVARRSQALFQVSYLLIGLADYSIGFVMP